MNQQERFVMYVEQAKEILQHAQNLAMDEHDYNKSRFVENALNPVNALLHLERIRKK